jgi:hypothetical protein
MHDILNKVFFQDPKHYARLDNKFTHKQVLFSWHKAYLVYGWKAVARYRLRATIPYAYAIPKNNDLYQPDHFESVGTF